MAMAKGSGCESNRQQLRRRLPGTKDAPKPIVDRPAGRAKGFRAEAVAAAGPYRVGEFLFFRFIATFGFSSPGGCEGDERKESAARGYRVSNYTVRSIRRQPPRTLVRCRDGPTMEQAIRAREEAASPTPLRRAS